MRNSPPTIGVSLTPDQAIQFSQCLNPSTPMRCRGCVGCELNEQILGTAGREPVTREEDASEAAGASVQIVPPGLHILKNDSQVQK